MKSCAAEGRWEVLLHLVEEAILVEEEAGAARVGRQLLTSQRKKLNLADT